MRNISVTTASTTGEVEQCKTANTPSPTVRVGGESKLGTVQTPRAKMSTVMDRVMRPFFRPRAPCARLCYSQPNLLTTKTVHALTNGAGWHNMRHRRRKRCWSCHDTGLLHHIQGHHHLIRNFGLLRLRARLRQSHGDSAVAEEILL